MDENATADNPFARLVSLACHDLRTPLATVVGFAHTLTRQGGLEEPAGRYVEMIGAAAGQLGELVDELSLGARIEAGRYDPVLREVDSLELARKAADACLGTGPPRRGPARPRSGHCGPGDSRAGRSGGAGRRLAPDPARVKGLVNVSDFEEAARAKLDPGPYAYYAGGSGDEQTLRANVEAFTRWELRPRVLVDVGEVSTRTEVLGTEVAFPVLVAPTAFQRLADPEGELATARAAAGAGTVMCLSTIASVSPAELAAAVPGAPLWFQLYWSRDRGFTKELLAGVAEAGFRALVLTVDFPIAGNRERDTRFSAARHEGAEHDSRLETVTGDIGFAGQFVRGGAFDFDSHSGAIDIAVPDKTPASFSVVSIAGKITNNLSNTSPIAGRFGRGEELTMDASGGGPRVSVRTSPAGRCR